MLPSVLLGAEHLSDVTHYTHISGFCQAFFAIFLSEFFASETQDIYPDFGYLSNFFHPLPGSPGQGMKSFSFLVLLL